MTITTCQPERNRPISLHEQYRNVDSMTRRKEGQIRTLKHLQKKLATGAFPTVESVQRAVNAMLNREFRDLDLLLEDAEALQREITAIRSI